MKSKLLTATASIAIIALAQPAAATPRAAEQQSSLEDGRACGTAPGGDNAHNQEHSGELACAHARAIAAGAALTLAATSEHRNKGASAKTQLGKTAAPTAAAPNDSLRALAQQVDIPYEQFMLPNGLRVLVHTDRKAPVVAVSVWYDVGSKHEPKGKTGFAHLFEHLMFNGSENADEDYFKPMQDIGATSLNGTTWYDRTNYYETVPTGALEKTLYLESDRMGYLLGAITQEKLDNQRGVVQNEKRQGENQPFGLVDYIQTAALFPADHPYGHSTIGSMADLDAASLADVHGWFKAHYGANNAIVALAGDIDVPTAKRLMSQYFGGIKAGPKTKPVAAPVPTLPKRKDETISDRVSTTRLYRTWIVPGLNDVSAIPLDIGASVLGGLASSRLDNLLVRDEQLAVQVTAQVQSFAQMGQFDVTVDVKPGIDADKVAARLDQILADYIAKGPSDAEVKRAATQQITQYVKGLEAVGGKASVLAEGALYSNDPEKYRRDLAAYAAATPDSVTAALKAWLSRPVYALTVKPGPRTPLEDSGAGKREAAFAAEAAANKTAAGALPEIARVQRDAAPQVAEPETLTFPKVERAKLANGIEIVYAQRRAVPMTLVSLSLDAGLAADAPQARGTAAMTTALLKEGAGTRGSIAIAERQEELGASINAGSGLDRSQVTLSALSTNLAPSLDLFADIALRPTFAPAEVARVRDQMLASIAADQTNAGAIAANLLAPALYGADHPYGAGSGKGEAAVVAKLGRDDLQRFHQSWFRPEKAKLFVVSDRPLAEIAPLLEARFGSWRGEGEAGTKSVSAGPSTPTPRIILYDRKDSPQSQISAGQLFSLRGRDEHLNLSSAAEVVGGGFLSRINMDLRETKGWSYGVRAGIGEREGQMSYQISAPVQADRTGESIAALIADYQAFLGPKGVTQTELERTQNGDIRELPGAFETAGAVMGALQQNALYGRPDDYYAQLPTRIRALDTTRLDAAARAAIDPAKLIWVVVGDAATVKPQLDRLGLPVEVVPAP